MPTTSEDSRGAAAGQRILRRPTAAGVISTAIDSVGRVFLTLNLLFALGWPLPIISLKARQK